MAAIANAGKPAPAAAASEDPTAAATEAASSLERSVDLCIVMDCTGSMAAWIDACRDTLIAALDALRAKFPRASFRAAFIGYRDHCDAERFVLHPLNENVDALTASIRAVRAQGGGDTPEDVAGGLQHALALDWRGDVRLALLCCDAPAHGERYHEPMMDDAHPKGDPTGLDPAALVKALAQRRIDLTVFRVNKSVDKMCALFKAAHAEGAAAEGGAGEDANFVLMNVEQQLGAATRTHHSGFDFASCDFSRHTHTPATFSLGEGGGFGAFGVPAAPAAAAPAPAFSFGAPATSAPAGAGGGFGGFGAPAAPAFAFGAFAPAMSAPATSAGAPSLSFGIVGGAGGFGGGGFGCAPAMAMAPGGPSPQAQAFSSAVGDSVTRCMASSARRA